MALEKGEGQDQRSSLIAAVVFAGCILIDRGLSFPDFADGAQTPGFPRTSIFDRTRVRRWFEDDMPAFFNAILSSWLPRLSHDHF